jgi:hypothetical protein
LSIDEQDGRTSGGVPNAFGNALSWRWTRDMSAYLRRSGLPLLLCQLRNFANASGEIAFSGDRKPIRITDIAAAACCREKDARRYLDAAVRAGVVQVLGDRKRGKATRYALVVHPFPDWQAAEDYLKSTARDNTARPPMWSEEGDTADESSGHSGPNQYGPFRPELTGGKGNEVRATPARMGSGHSGPNGSGHSGPNNPGGFQGTSHDGAEVGFQPQVVGASGPQDHPPQEDTTGAELAPGWIPCERCHDPMLPRFGRRTHAHCPPITNRERHSA